MIKLTTEGLDERGTGTYPAYYLVEVCEMCLAVPAAEDLA